MISLPIWKKQTLENFSEAVSISNDFQTGFAKLLLLFLFDQQKWGHTSMVTVQNPVKLWKLVGLAISMSWCLSWDICSCNICSSFSIKEYLSWYLSDFDHTLTYIFLGPKSFLIKILGSNVLWAQHFLDLNFLDPKLLSTQRQLNDNST